jgi:hypothetical protein
MFPGGTRVTVRSVKHISYLHRPTHLVGRTGTVIGHTKDGMHQVAGLYRTEFLFGYWLFGFDHLTEA